jgi:hypothetical protein
MGLAIDGPPPPKMSIGKTEIRDEERCFCARKQLIHVALCIPLITLLEQGVVRNQGFVGRDRLRAAMTEPIELHLAPDSAPRRDSRTGSRVSSRYRARPSRGSLLVAQSAVYLGLRPLCAHLAQNVVTGVLQRFPLGVDRDSRQVLIRVIGDQLLVDSHQRIPVRIVDWEARV